MIYCDGIALEVYVLSRWNGSSSLCKAGSSGMGDYMGGSSWKDKIM